jgi:hypothetical protein
MLCLRCSFDTWVDNEPEELDHPPTEAEEEALREKENLHSELFASMEHLASKLSSTLGVGKITDKRLRKDIGVFFKEGIRWAFSTQDDKGQDEYFLGSRFPFLSIIGKYKTWLKEKSLLGEIKDRFLDHHHQFLNHPDFVEVQNDDLNHLRDFAKMLGIPERELSLPDEDETTVFTDYTSKANNTPSPHDSSPRRSRSSTAGSARSRMSSRSALSPLPETDGDIDEEKETMDGSPKKRRRLHSSLGSVGASVASSVSRSTLQTRGTIEEEQGDGDGDESDHRDEELGTQQSEIE